RVQARQGRGVTGSLFFRTGRLCYETQSHSHLGEVICTFFPLETLVREQGLVSFPPHCVSLQSRRGITSTLEFVAGHVNMVFLKGRTIMDGISVRTLSLRLSGLPGYKKLFDGYKNLSWPRPRQEG